MRLGRRGRQGRGAAAVAVGLLTTLALAGGANLGIVVALASAQGASSRGPEVSAPAAILIVDATGETVFARRQHEQRPIASATKLMTAKVVLGDIGLDDVLTTRAYTGSPLESTAGLLAGERLSVRDLLRALLLTSANDAAATLADAVSGTTANFVSAMNAEAKTLGLKNTEFANPIGLDSPQNHSSAADLAKLARVLRRSPFFRQTVARPSAKLKTGSRNRTVVNRNRLVRSHPWVDGVKTGHTASAGYVLVGSGTRNGVTMISVVLGTASEEARERDTLALLRWGLARYELARPVVARRVDRRVALELAGDRTVAVAPSRSYSRVVRRGEQLVVASTVPTNLRGPLKRGAKVGELNVLRGNQVLARVPVVTTAAVPAPTLAARAGHALTSPGGAIGALLIVLGSLQLVRIRRRKARRKKRSQRGKSETR